MIGIQSWLMAAASVLLAWPWTLAIAPAAAIVCAATIVAVVTARTRSTDGVSKPGSGPRAPLSSAETTFKHEQLAHPSAVFSAVQTPAPMAHASTTGPLRGRAEWRTAGDPAAQPAASHTTSAVLAAPPDMTPFRAASNVVATELKRANLDSPVLSTSVPFAAPSQDTLAEQEYRRGLRLLVRQGSDREETLRTALACFRRAQEYWSRDRAPQRWAAIQNDIGRVYQELPGGDRTQQIRTAIMHHETALEVFDPIDHPLNWAWTQAALGAAYLNTPSGSPIVNARAAVAYYQRALDVFTRENAPLAWAWNQNNLGAAYETMRGGADGERVAHLRDAEHCYEASLLVFTDEDYPTQHQLVTRNLERVQADLRALE